MESERVSHIEELIAPKLRDGEKVVETEISRLTAPGENYGSIMLRILVTVADAKTKQKRTLDTVGKTVPYSEFVRKVFNTDVTFVNEYKFYAETVPAFDTFLKGNNISTGTDFLAPFINGRLNLDGGDKLGAGAIIYMENLRTAGYSTGKKSIGLDLDHAKVVLKSLARLHAAGIGLKIKEPTIFENKVKRYFYTYAPEGGLQEMVKIKFEETLITNGYSKEKAGQLLGLFEHGPEKVNVSEIWGTVIHYDSWTNNLLINYENGKPSNCILVDFQVFDYGTPLNDVMFFFFTSIQDDILENKVDYLLDYYYKTVIKDLQTLGVATANFTRASFDNEIAVAVKNYEFYHALWMLPPLLVEHFTNLDDMNTADDKSKGIEWNHALVKRILKITKISSERQWI